MRILIVEDEASIANFVRDGLEEEGYAVDVANNGKQGLQLALDYLEEYDVILLDWMLPGLSGIEICRNIRKQNKVVFGLETGADDYIRKPFSFEELLARIRVHMRKGQTQPVLFSAAGIEMDIEKHTVSKNGAIVELTQKEFSLLEYFLRNKGKVCRRTGIIEKVWDIHFDYDTSVIDVYVNALRKKLDEPGKSSVIITVRGVGYKIEEEWA